MTEPLSPLLWIVAGGLLMMAVALLGGVSLLMSDRLVRRLLLPLVSLAAGSLIGGAFFHMIPAALRQIPDPMQVWLLVIAGFTVFFALEQFLHWHHGHGVDAGAKKPLTYLLLLGDGLHNFIGGAAIAGTFLIDIRLGIASWLAAAMHELPQELGDFAVLVHGGWSKLRALVFNLLSASTFLIGGLLTYALSDAVDVAYLVPFAAGNFLYIGATDLVPEVNKSGSMSGNIAHLAMFSMGLVILYMATFVG